MKLRWGLPGIFAIALGLLARPTIATATVLTMDGEVSNTNNAAPPPAGGNAYGPLGNGSTIVSEYGDYVSGATQTNVSTVDFGAPPYWYNFSYGNNGEGYTPNVKVAKLIVTSNNTTATRSWTSAGNLSKVAYPATSTTAGGKWYWTFTADPGYLVNLISTDVVLFTSGPLATTLNVYSGDDPLSLGGLLYSSGSVNATNVGQTVPLSGTGSALTLEFNLPAGASLSGNWAADNIVFSQRAVPEPATAVLSIVALGAIARRRTRMSR